MTRPRAQAYRTGELSELTRQLLYAPASQRADVVRRAERLHDELEPTKNYPIDFVVYRLTDRRVPPNESVMLVGEAVRPDLRLLIDALSRSIEMQGDPADPGLTTRQWAEQLGVSTKTIARWRDRGLRWRWGVRQPGDKPMVLITHSAMDAYRSVGDRAGQVQAAAGFTRMDAAEKTALIQRARRLAEATDQAPKLIYRHLSKRTGRSIEALRLLITGHDERYPAQAVFADRSGPLTDEQKQAIDYAYRRGDTVSAMCRRYNKTRSTIYRALHAERALRATLIEINVIGSPLFDRPDADEVILRPIEPDANPRTLEADAIQSLPAAIRPAYDRAIASDATNRANIVRYNFLKHRALQMQRMLNTQSPRAADLDRFDELLRKAQQARGKVIAGMLPVVLSVVRRQLAGRMGLSEPQLLATLDRANAVLIEEVERFDTARSHSFESVLTNRLLRELAQEAEPLQVDETDVLARLQEAGFTAPESQSKQETP